MKMILGLLLTLFLTSTSTYLAAEPKIVLFIAADHSGSMNDGRPETQLQAQTAAFLHYFRDAYATCGTQVQVEYFAWGQGASYLVSGVMGDENGQAMLASGVELLGSQWHSSSTEHAVAYRYALSLLADYPDDYQKILLFTTDQFSDVMSGQNLQELVPDDVFVYVITYGSDAVRDYGDEDLTPASHGRHLHVSQSVSPMIPVAQVLDAVTMSVCGGV